MEETSDDITFTYDFVFKRNIALFKEGIITWSIFASWFFNRTLSKYPCNKCQQSETQNFKLVLKQFDMKLF